MKYRSDLFQTTPGNRPVGEPKSVTLTHYTDVWIRPNEVRYRVESPSLNDKGELQVNKREIFLTKSYGAYQDYNVAEVGSDGPWKVGFIRVIPAFGDAMTYDVNDLQTPTDNYLTRNLLTAKLPVEWNGVPLNYTNPIVYRNFNPETLKITVPSSPNMEQLRCVSRVGQVSEIVRENGYDQKQLDTHKDITWKDGKIVAFVRDEISSQAQTLISPRSTSHYELVSEDDSDCPVVFAKGARVFDYRLCPPSMLNSFPPKNCAAKIYWMDKELLRLNSLKDQLDAGMNDEPVVEKNQVPLWGYALVVLLFLVGLGALVKLRRLRASRP
ncbi:MAG: hypothetical protein ACOYON_15745 [Fimbriimonas sp.]